MGSDNGQRVKRQLGRSIVRILRDLFMACVGVLIGVTYCLNTRSWREVGEVTVGSTPNTVAAAALASRPQNLHETKRDNEATRNSLPVLSANGWNPIHVYFGDTNHLTKEIPEEYRLDHVEKNKNGTRWFAQHRQDVEIFTFLKEKKNGFFVDLAANDAVWASNTFALEQNYGWTGICIEPNPFYWFRLSFRNCHAVGAMVGNVTKLEVGAKFSNGPYGGIVAKQFDNSKLHQAEIQRYTASLRDILDLFQAPKEIDYMSLDVEGAEEFIMSNFPFDTYMFRAMSIERPKPGLKDLLEKNGYVFVKDFRRGDTLWALKSVVETSTTS